MGFINLIKKYYLLEMQGKKGAERNIIKSMRRGEAKLILIANNCPAIRRTELEYYAALCGSAVHNFEGNNLELGTACGKLFAVSTMIISDPGDSDILETL